MNQEVEKKSMFSLIFCIDSAKTFEIDPFLFRITVRISLAGDLNDCEVALFFVV